MFSLLKRAYLAIPSPMRRLVPRRLREYVKQREDARYAYQDALRQLYTDDELNPPAIRLLKIGVRAGPSGAFRTLHDLGELEFVGIEPDASECDRFREEWPEYTFHEVAVADSHAERTLHLTKYRNVSSLYEPNHEFLDRFGMFDNEYRVERTEPIKVQPLDDIVGDPAGFDVVILDTQGSEADIFAGGKRVVSNSRFLKFETHFKQIYVGEQTFEEYYPNLVESGFDLVDLDFSRWARTVKVGGGDNAQRDPYDGELVEAHASMLDRNGISSKAELYRLLSIALLIRKQSIAYQLLADSAEHLSASERTAIRHILDGLPKNKLK